MGFSIVSRRAFLLSSAMCQGLILLGSEEPSPFVEVYKPIFARGEVIRVRVGVKASGIITPKEQRPGVLHVVRPDGVRESQLVSWPRDTNQWGWTAGASLGNSPVLLGLYRLSFEWDRRRSPEAELTVREWDLRDRIVARWVFKGDDFQHAFAVLEVENQTDQVLRFARLGMTGSGVWLRFAQAGPNPSREDLFYPWEELVPNVKEHGVGVDEARWRNLDRLPVVTLEPRHQYSQALSLAKVRLQFPVVNPKVEIGTVLTVFVGEMDDAMSALYPVRLEVRAGRRFN